MSIETLLVGTIEFKERPSKKVLKEIAELLELDLPIQQRKEKQRYVDYKKLGTFYYPESKTLEFTSLNWSSHVDDTKLEELGKYKHLFEDVSISLYYLSEASAYISYHDGETFVVETV